MLFRVILALAITFSVMAAEVRLGPEMRLLAGTEALPEAHSQSPIGLVSSGSDFLALWQTVAGGEQTFQLARIEEITTAPYRIGFRTSAVTAADRDGLLFVFTTNSTVWAYRTGNDAEFTSGAVIVTSKVASPRATHLLFDGSAFLLLVSDPNGVTTALILDREGNVLRELPPLGRVVWAGVQNGAFAVIDGTGLTAYVLHRLTALGARTDIPLNLPKDDISFVAASPSHIFAGQRQIATLLELDGRVARQTPLTPCTPGERRPSSAWWDGSRFVSTCLDGTGRLDAKRYREDGTPDGGPTLLSTTADGVPLFATNGIDRILVWADHHFSEDSDVVARVVHGSDSVAPGAELELVSYASRKQRAVQIARVGAHRLAMWSNEDGGFESALDGRSVIVESGYTRPAVVAGTRSFLTLWYSTNDTSDLLARRIGLAGELLDSQPRVLASNPTTYATASPGAGFHAPLFVAAAPGDYGHALVRGITEDGEVVDVTAPGGRSNYIIVKPMWIGNDLLFANGSLGGGVVGFFERYFKFGVARAGVDSVDAVQSGGFYGSSPARGAIAQGPDRLTFAWVEDVASCHTCVAFAQSAFDGRRLRDRTVVAKEPVVSEVEVVWDGAEFVIAWSTGDRIRAMRFDLNGQLLDASPFDISPPGATADRPSFAVTSTGVDIAYTRFDEQAGGAARAFVRSLDRVQPLIGRGRSVRH